jgi:hypothetical protein
LDLGHDGKISKAEFAACKTVIEKVSAFYIRKLAESEEKLGLTISYLYVKSLSLSLSSLRVGSVEDCESILELPAAPFSQNYFELMDSTFNLYVPLIYIFSFLFVQWIGNEIVPEEEFAKIGTVQNLLFIKVFYLALNSYVLSIIGPKF